MTVTTKLFKTAFVLSELVSSSFILKKAFFEGFGSVSRRVMCWGYSRKLAALSVLILSMLWFSTCPKALFRIGDICSTAVRWGTSSLSTSSYEHPLLLLKS